MQPGEQYQMHRDTIRVIDHIQKGSKLPKNLQIVKDFTLPKVLNYYKDLFYDYSAMEQEEQNTFKQSLFESINMLKINKGEISEKRELYRTEYNKFLETKILSKIDYSPASKLTPELGYAKMSAIAKSKEKKKELENYGDMYKYIIDKENRISSHIKWH